MPTSCWLQALALPTLAAQKSRAPGALNSLLQHLHSSSSPLPFPSPATTVLVPPSLETGALGRCAEYIWPQAQRPPSPALHRGRKEPGYITVKHWEQENLWGGSGAI